MSAGGDIIWTSFIPGLNNIEQMNFELDSHGEATHEGTAAHGEAPAAHSVHPAYHVSTGLLIGLVIIVLALIAKRSIKSGEMSDEDLVPTSKLSVRNIMELMVTAIAKIMEDSMGDVWPRFLHLVGTLAFFILFSNLIGLVPGFLPPTESINTTAACGLIVFFATHYYGFKEHGFAYLKHFMGPFWWLAPLMLPIEIISHLARPLSLALRLFGNINGDHKVGAIFFSLVAIGVPVITLFLGVFVSFVQTFVFCLLTMVYLGGAIAHEH
ncbi:MAG: ATP synthase F0 subunit A [Deltaproteobacteria bacterium]|nr:MAG: ATP synthase F0 subunit A [Deltaproteobacteria bacterium]